MSTAKGKNWLDEIMEGSLNTTANVMYWSGWIKDGPILNNVNIEVFKYPTAMGLKSGIEIETDKHLDVSGIM